MESTKIYEDLSRVAEALLENKTLEKVLETISRTACSFFKASASSIMLFDEKKEYLTIAFSCNLSPEYLRVVRVKKNEEVAGKVCQEKRYRFIPDVLKLFKNIGDEFTVNWAKKEGLISLVCAPLLLKNEPIGALNIYFRSPRKSFYEEKPLEFFTRLAALSIEHTRLINESEEKTRMVTILEQIGLLITSSFDISEIIKVFLSTSVSIADADSGSLILINEAANRILDAYEYQRGTDRPTRYHSTARLNQGISGQVIRTKRPVIISDLDNYPDVNPVVKNKGRAAVAALPMMARGTLIGILYVNCNRPREFSKTEIDYITMLSNQAAIAIHNTQLYNKLSREAKEMALLYEVSQSFISTLDFDKLLNNILKRLKDLFGYLNLAIFLVDEKKQELYLRSYINYPEDIKNLKIKIGETGITGYVALTKKMYYAPDVSKDPYYIKGVEEARSEICIPLMIGNRLAGVIDIESPEIDGFSQDDIRLLSSMSAQLAMALENARLYEEAKKLSLTDPLTELPNRRSFELFIDTELKRAKRYHRPFSILMIDFDNFKNYNDKCGHPAGDQIIIKFSQLMKETIRDVDFLGRYGGDEFIAVLPETDATFAFEVAERMRKHIEDQKIKPNVTLSIGIASYPQDAFNKKDLIQLADQACYEAKEMGGNCVNFAAKLNNKEKR